MDKKRKQELEAILKYAGDRGIPVPADSLLEIMRGETEESVLKLEKQIEEIRRARIITPDQLPIFTLGSPGAVPAPRENDLILTSLGWRRSPSRPETVFVGGGGGAHFPTGGPGYLYKDAIGVLMWAAIPAGAGGDVFGPAASINGNFAIFNGLTGKIIADSGVNAGSFQPIDATLTTLSALADAAGWLHDNGAGVLAWTTPTSADVGSPALVNPSVVGNFVSFSNITGAQQDSGFSAASFQAALAFPLAPNLGGTGIANAVGSTLTLGAATSITGGGTISLGGFTATVPATGTVAMLGVRNVFTVQQMVDGSIDEIQLRVQANGTQTANLQTWESSAGTVLGYVDGNGYLGFVQTVNQKTTPSVLGQQTAATLQDGSAYTGTDATMATQYIAVKITASGAHTMGDFTIRIKESADITNYSGAITGYIYADDGGVPSKPTGAALATGLSIRFGTITNSYQTLSVGTTYTMAAGTAYWLVLKWSATPSGGNIVLDSDVSANMGATSTDGVNWTNTNVRLRHMIRGVTFYGVYGVSTNENGVYGVSINRVGVSGSSTNNVGVYGISTNSYGVYGSSTNSYGVQGTSTSSVGVYGQSTSSVGAYGTSTSGTGVYGTSASGVGIYGVSATNMAGRFDINPSSTNTVDEVVRIVRNSSGTAAAGIGARMDWYLEDASGNTDLCGRILTLLTNATHGAEVSAMTLWARQGGSSIVEAFRVVSSGITIGSGVGGIDYTITVDGDTNDGLITWMEDEDYFLFGDDIFIGTEHYYFNGTDTALYESSDDIHLDTPANKTLVLDEVVWDDLRIFPGSFDRPGVTDPTIVAYDVGGGGVNSYLWQFQKNAVASFVVQLPHSYKVGTDIAVHIHWTPGPRGAAESGNTVGWKVQYSWANIDGTFGAMQTADLSDACDGTNHKHQMTPDITIDGHTASKGISSMLICNVTRTDTGADDTWAGTASGELPMILEIDFHYQIDTIGSRQQSAK